MPIYVKRVISWMGDDMSDHAAFGVQIKYQYCMKLEIEIKTRLSGSQFLLTAAHKDKFQLPLMGFTPPTVRLVCTYLYLM